MKGIIYLLLFIVIVSCKTKEISKKDNEYNCVVKSTEFNFELKQYPDYHEIYYLRKTDSIRMDLKIYPNLTEVFKLVNFDKCNSAAITIEKVNNEILLKQISFLLKNNQKVLLHEGTEDIYNIDLEKYNIEIVESVGYDDLFSVLLYSKRCNCTDW